ncbi:DUF6155 family protein [bacterium]|nr:DUF6155 family protein [bacterium]
MGLREVKKELIDLEKEELIYHISELYKKYKPVKEYFDFFANPDEEVILNKFKERVHEGFYPNRGWRLKLYRSRKAINEFKKLGISSEAECDLLLYFTEVAVSYAREKNTRTESFYVRLENSLEKAMEHMLKHDHLALFENRIDTLISRSSSFPWSCYERLIDIKSTMINSR